MITGLGRLDLNSRYSCKDSLKWQAKEHLSLNMRKIFKRLPARAELTLGIRDNAVTDRCKIRHIPA